MKILEGIEDKHYDNFSLLFEFSALGLHQENKNLILQLSGFHIEFNFIGIVIIVLLKSSEKKFYLHLNSCKISAKNHYQMHGNTLEVSQVCL